ncbi:MAG: hypothetical protein HQK92_01510 [Nitrospirae bacterium]|nr:hypothetical protein [Nitrospirota bacterium]
MLFFVVSGGLNSYSETTDNTKAVTSTSVYTYVYVESIGNVAIKITYPSTTRYTDGAPVIIYVTPVVLETISFLDNSYINRQGFITVEFLWPGQQARVRNTYIKSDGTFDYGGQNSIKALRDIALFSMGLNKNADGDYIGNIMPVTPLQNNVGIYAYSHPGMEATNLLVQYGADIQNLAYLVLMESPTADKIYALEIGYYDADGVAQYNPYYSYPDNYHSSGITLDYSTIGWCVNSSLYPDGRPCFNSKSSNPFVLSDDFPTIYGKRTYSTDLTNALYKNVFSNRTWPSDVATPDEAKQLWSFRSIVNNYSLIASNNLNTKIMLVFGNRDHKQVANDKPHIHQAYDGFHKTAGLWVRLNPDSSYMLLIDSSLDSSSLPDKDANTEPSDWQYAEYWGYSDSIDNLTEKASFAAILEMADRVYNNDWSVNLNNVLVNTAHPYFK